MSDDEYVRDPTTGQEYTIRRGSETIIGDLEVTGNLTNNGSPVGVGAGVDESEISLSDNTTNNASTTKHGFLRKLSNVATEYMNGVGNWVSLVLPVKASGADVDTGTDDAKFVTAKALEDSDYIKEADLPPGGGSVTLETPTPLPDDVEDTFTGSAPPKMVFRNGVMELRLGSVVGSTFVFDTPPATGDDIEFVV